MRSMVLIALALLGVSAEYKYDCPSEGQFFFPHPYICSKFVECNDGVAAEQDCFAKLVFNPNAGFCDFPDNYPCKDKVPEGPVGTCPPVNGEFVDFLTDATRCEIFYMCNWGTPIQMDCPPGLHFNPTLNVCDYPHSAGCKPMKSFM